MNKKKEYSKKKETGLLKQWPEVFINLKQ